MVYMVSPMYRTEDDRYATKGNIFCRGRWGDCGILNLTKVFDDSHTVYLQGPNRTLEALWISALPGTEYSGHCGSNKFALYLKKPETTDESTPD